MPATTRSSRGRRMPPNRQAYVLLGMLIERTGMRKGGLLARLAEAGYPISDNTFTNWGRPNRSFPRDWALLRAIVAIVSDQQLEGRCSASEALRFLSLTEFPFSELHALAALFSAAEFNQALLAYLPTSLVDLSTSTETVVPFRRKAS